MDTTIRDDNSLEIRPWPVTGQALILLPEQVHLLYALGEADDNSLPYEGLYEVVRGRPVNRFTRREPLQTTALDRLRDLLAPLVEAELVIDKGDGDRPRLTVAGLQLITWLTRDWADWQTYSQQAGIYPF